MTTSEFPEPSQAQTGLRGLGGWRLTATYECKTPAPHGVRRVRHGRGAVDDCRTARLTVDRGPVDSERIGEYRVRSAVVGEAALRD